MNEVVIIGYGGMARDVAWLIEDNNVETNEWNILGYVTNEAAEEIKGEYPILGDDLWLLNQQKHLNVVIAIGDGKIRKRVYEKLKVKDNISFPTIISRRAIISPKVIIGQGTIVCASAIVTVNIQVGDFTIINLDSTIEHDSILGDFVTISPSVNISGNVEIKDLSTVGTGVSIKQGIIICKEAIVGAGAVVINNIEQGSMVAGCPAKKIKRAIDK